VKDGVKAGYIRTLLSIRRCDQNVESHSPAYVTVFVDLLEDEIILSGCDQEDQAEMTFDSPLTGAFARCTPIVRMSLSLDACAVDVSITLTVDLRGVEKV